MVGVNVFIHATQFPDAVRRKLVESLRTRRINHKFHYDSYKQAQKWLALHEAFSPARTDADCLRVYDEAFEAATAGVGKDIHVIGLGCGGGQKEAALLKLLKNGTSQVSYSPCDVALALVLTARNAALELVADERCWPMVCDLAEANGLVDVFAAKDHGAAQRIFTFFGMIPNFEPAMILPKLRSLLRSGDRLLFSANLAPADDYGAGVRTILPQYENELTEEWLLTLLLDLGVEPGDGEIVFTIEKTDGGYLRVVADFEFVNARLIRLGNEGFAFGPGEKVRLFFSYRYQPKHIEQLLREQGVEVVEQWITTSREEGVFLCKLV